MVSFSLPLKEPSQNQLQLPTLAGMLQAPGRVVPRQLEGTQGREEQLERAQGGQAAAVRHGAGRGDGRAGELTEVEADEV